jgi:hypothetical protein
VKASVYGDGDCRLGDERAARYRRHMSTAPTVLRRLLPGAASVLAACASPGGEAPASTPTPTATAAAQAAAPVAPAAAPFAGTSSRAPDEQEQAAMVEILTAESAPERAAWIAVMPGNADSQALGNALKEAFEKGGWKVELQPVTGMALKPGLSILIAEEEPPGWTDSARKALEASGNEVKAAIGYRPYYDEKKAADPNWVGVPIGADQAFVIVVGPPPPPPA